MSAAVIARVTLADALRQPFTWLATGLGVVLVLLSGLFGMFNFMAEDRLRMAATAGVAAGMMDGLVLAAVLASLAVHLELSDRTALTLFAKPVSRGAFLVGKAAGVFGAAAASCLVVALAHLGMLWVGSTTGFEWESHLRPDEPIAVPWAAVVSAHVLGLMHTLVIACLATGLAIRVPLAINVTVCLAAFVLGHLLPGWGIIPALATYHADDAIQGTGLRLDLTYVGLAGLYTALLCAGFLAVALAVFQRQDIR